jgi:hypothetical protein
MTDTADRSEQDPDDGYPNDEEARTKAADSGKSGSEPPPAEFDPADEPSNPDLVGPSDEASGE